MGSGIIQPSFTSGEMSPSLHGRVDFARYYTGLKTCRNYIIRQYGGVVNRPGTKFVVETKGSAAVRLIPFSFSTEQTYVLEFGPYYMRVIKDGAPVVYPSGHASEGLPVEIVTPYDAADLGELTYTQSADVMTLCHQNYAPRQLSRTDHHVWTLATFSNTNGPFQTTNASTSTTIYSDDYEGNITITASASIFTDDQVGLLMYIEQSPDGLTQRWEVSKHIAVNEIRRAGNNFYQAVTSGTTGTVRPSVEEGVEHDGDPGVSWKYLHSGYGIAVITAVTSGTVATATVLKRLPDQVVTGSSTKTVTNAVANSATEVRLTVNVHGFYTGQIVTIAGVEGCTEANGTWTVTVINTNTIDLTGVTFVNPYTSGGTATASWTATPTYKWAFEAWGEDDQLYPRTTHYYQQRQIFGGSYGGPQDVWMSTVAGYTDFGTHISLVDDDAISMRLVSREVNEIRHFVDLNKLIALTSGGAFVLSGNDDSSAVTPTSITANRQTSYGCSTIRPVIVGNQALYLQDKNNRVRSLGYSFAEDSYIGNDLTLLSSHLFKNRTVVDWAFQEDPWSVVWAVRDDGALLGLTYLPEHEVVAWHRHDTDGEVERVCTVSEDDVDALYLVVKRTVNGLVKRFIERLDDRDWEDIEDAFFVDCGLSYDGYPATTFSGLDHLEGETVAILADGMTVPQQIVTSGAVTLAHAASVVHIGLPYTSDLETLEVNVSGNNLLDRAKLITSVGLLVEDTASVWVGPDEDHLYEHKGRTVTNYGDAVNLMTGLVEVPTAATWSKQGRVFVRNSDPLPSSILAIIPDVTTGGK